MKIEITAILLAIVLCLTGITVAAKSDFTYGDVNHDGKIDANDALLVLQFSVGTIGLDSRAVRAGSVAGFGRCNATSALYILRKAVGKIQRFPIEDITLTVSDS